MRILFLAHAFNSLTQRLWAELGADGHETTLELDINDATTVEAVRLARPDVILAPFMKRAIPAAVWREHRCLVVHPGIVGDRGPSALDWAIARGEREWGVTVLQANADMDAGDVWSTATFPMREATKGSLYRNEVAQAAVIAVREALDGIAAGRHPRPLATIDRLRGTLRPPMRQADRAIDWQRDDTATVVRKIRAADGMPGVRDSVRGVDCFLYGAHASTERDAGAKPGEVIAQRRGAVLRATRDGAVWITHAKPAGERELAVKLPAADVLRSALGDVATHAGDAGLPPPIAYEEQADVGIVHFAFHNGAMSASDCDALRDAIVAAKRRPTRVIVLAGGPDFWSNGLDLNRIEASEQPADASWSNIAAMNRVVREIVLADRHVTIAAMQGNAGAGGCFLALAADEVIVRTGAVLNPHYRSMGNLYGSEYWTYLLPRRLGAARAAALMAQRQPMTGAQAAGIGLADQALGETPAACLAAAIARAHSLARPATLGPRLARKGAQRTCDEAAKPLDRYAEEELEHMRLNFYGFDPSYHVARRHFVCKLPKARTPSFLARHRALARRPAAERIPVAG